ncbi:3-phosphoserine/phosphohydroxythreonine transaminase [Paraliomyxa miuraensis]|uniref:3-phosphoserine/phosphohydroxythreonine transaminase n=1 Tax=Paraliomyxa miuraensis TaxID=376150 RepID=UPI00225291AC|nr:3-phosphoserine/phosphohydroxythreonine transaminase [Paraliomyxa miuraensis]MCX4241970.1 3-phosphoserine/phosphohydroxythreonine transaminase [Paraliomyxa miuraensis]
MTERPFNFSAGPAILPPAVFERTAAAIRSLDVPGDDSLESRLSILEISHRSKTYDAIHEEAIALCHEVLGVPKEHAVLFLQGGASTQFAMVPMNLRQADRPAAYIDTGVWSKKAIEESKALGATEVVASSKASGYDHIPAMPGPQSYAGASYLHITSNNTIYGTEWEDMPDTGDTPLVVDFSSNIGARPMAMDRVALGYAGAQKNLGPSGVTLVFIRKDLLERTPVGHVPTMLRYGIHAENNSLYNTPNTFGIMVLRNVLAWVKDEGGAVRMGERNRRKADEIYAVLDGSSLYRPHAKVGSRSTMNVTWTLQGDDAEAQTKRFLAKAEAAGLSGLKGHRSVGGCRASIYNAFPEAGVGVLCEFMREFERTA